jgi:hypothetical protein
MSVDATTQAGLEAPTLRWRVLCYIDFSGDVLRATTGLYDKTIAASGDVELDGTYFSIDDRLVSVGEVMHQEEGTDTTTVSLSGLIVNNAEFLTLIGDKALWQGRTARLWFYLVDDNEVLVGEYIPYYTGYMNDVTISGSPSEQTVTLTIENYLTSMSDSENKTYLIQNLFDAGDTSAASSIAAGNGLIEGVISGGGGGGGGGGDRGYRGVRGMVEY